MWTMRCKMCTSYCTHLIYVIRFLVSFDNENMIFICIGLHCRWVSLIYLLRQRHRVIIRPEGIAENYIDNQHKGWKGRQFFVNILQMILFRWMNSIQIVYLQFLSLQKITGMCKILFSFKLGFFPFDGFKTIVKSWKQTLQNIKTTFHCVI